MAIKNFEESILIPGNDNIPEEKAVDKKAHQQLQNKFDIGSLNDMERFAVN